MSYRVDRQTNTQSQPQTDIDKKQESRVIAGEPRDAAVNFDRFGVCRQFVSLTGPTNRFLTR